MANGPNKFFPVGETIVKYFDGRPRGARRIGVLTRRFTALCRYVGHVTARISPHEDDADDADWYRVNYEDGDAEVRSRSMTETNFLKIPSTRFFRNEFPDHLFSVVENSGSEDQRFKNHGKRVRFGRDRGVRRYPGPAVDR